MLESVKQSIILQYMSRKHLMVGTYIVSMVGNHQPGNGSTDDCPERVSERGPDSHASELVEQPADMDVFYVHRCTECGQVFETWETERDYLDEFQPEDGREEHSKEFGGVFA